MGTEGRESRLPASERLEFRLWQLGDGALGSALWRDPEVMRYLGGPYSQAQVDGRLGREIENQERHGIAYWPIFLAGSSDQVGCCGLRPHHPGDLSYEIGFHLLPRYWGRGFASEAARAVIKFAFEELHATALFAGHHPENDASRALLSRLGFTQIGTHFFEPTGLQHPWYHLLPD